MVRKGLPKSIIKKYGISKKAWAVYRGKKSKSSNPRPKKKARKVRTYLARRRYSRKRRSRSRKMTVPLALVGGFAASVARPLKTALDTKDFQLAAWQLVEGYTGFYPGDGSFDVTRLNFGLVPLIMGAVVHKFVGGSPLNVNAALARANVPLVRV